MAMERIPRYVIAGASPGYVYGTDPMLRRSFPEVHFEITLHFGIMQSPGSEVGCGLRRDA